MAVPILTPEDFPGITGAEAGTPASGTRRLFTNSATGELSVRTSAGATVSLESGGSATFDYARQLAFGA